MSPPSAPFSLPSLLQSGWGLGKLALGAEEAIRGAQSPHAPVSPSSRRPPRPAAGFQELHYTRCLQYPPDNIQVASITARVRGGYSSSPLPVAPASPSRYHTLGPLSSPAPPV